MIKNKYILVITILLSIWNVSAYFFANNYFNSRLNEVVTQKIMHSQERAGDLADSIQRNLNYLHGIPDLFTQLMSVKKATSRFGTRNTPSNLPIEVRKERWSHDSELNLLSNYLERSQKNLNVDIIYVVNTAGDCIAASNWNSKGSTVGTNFKDREYFNKNKNGQSGIQYAVGKTTNIPGLYFSTPIIEHGHFLGAVIAKADIPNLSFLIKDLDAFVVDEYGVIVLARNKALELRSLAEATVLKLTSQERNARYRRIDFPIYKINTFGDLHFPSLMSVQDEDVPHVVSSNDVQKYGMKVFVADEVFEYENFNHDAHWLALLLGVSGSVVILIFFGMILYISSIKATDVALARANMAEKRIISISEDTQRQIGQELHDDLGQLLTGTAFMSEVLSNNLERLGINEAQVASKITQFINEAIAKTRTLAHGLYPVELKESGLPAMLNKLARNTEEIYSIKCEFFNEMDTSIDDPLAVINLFRIAQEAINNSIKHGKPKKISLRCKSHIGSVNLEICDDGSGFDMSRQAQMLGGVGLQSMQYRASLLGGVFSINPISSGGTRVAIILKS